MLEDLRKQLWLVGLFKGTGDDFEEFFNALILRANDLVEENFLLLILQTALLSAELIAQIFYGNSVVFASAQLSLEFGNSLIRIVDCVQCFSLATI